MTTALVLLVVVASTAWVAFDARQRAWNKDTFVSRWWMWVPGMLLLWIVIFPLYLILRNRVPAKV